jgi:hypothetical protein
MNLDRISNELRENILKREECVGFFVHSGEYHWIIDWEAHFNLNQVKNINAICEKPQYRRFLPNGLSVDEWRQQQLEEFREGIPTLTSELFPRYCAGQSAKIVSTDLLREEFFKEDAAQYAEISGSIERSLSFGTSMSEDLSFLARRLLSKLPKFYVNYDRRLFMHMVPGRAYEAVALDGWLAAEGDFEHMVPTSYRFWSSSAHEDFWAITKLSEI